MPLRLWRYITADFWRLLLIATAVLVTIIAFAATIRPLADGKLTPLQAISFMGLALVPMLAYAVPFAAGFAATLVYHRMAQDNEITAAYAGGIGHRSVLAPALISGVLLAGALGFVSDRAIPRFLRSMESYVKLDIADWMIVQLKLGNSFEFGGILLGAEGVTRLDPTTVPGAEDARSLVTLFQPAILFLDDDKTAETVATAEKAFLIVRPTTEQWAGPDAGAGATADGKPKFGAVVSLIAQNYRAVGTDSVIQSESQFRYDMAIPPVISDDPKFFTLAELAELRHHPERFDFIDEWRHRLALRTASIEMLDTIDATLRERGAVTMTGPGGSTVTLQAARLDNRRVFRRDARPATPGEPLALTVTSADGDKVERLEAAAALLNASYQDELTQQRPMLRLELEHVATSSQTARADIERATRSPEPIAGVRKRRTIPGLAVDTPSFDELRSMGVRPLLQTTLDLTQPPRSFSSIQEAHARLGRLEARLQNEITANQHERVAMSLAALVMVLTGAVVAIRLKDALPLTVYLWAFFPALGSVLVISMGKQLTHEFGFVGLVPLWLGVLVPLAYAVVTYRAIARR
ncbi:MAG: LptF/LptG family permease [Phycisphaerales bacterium]